MGKAQPTPLAHPWASSESLTLKGWRNWGWSFGLYPRIFTQTPSWTRLRPEALLISLTQNLGEFPLQKYQVGEKSLRINFDLQGYFPPKNILYQIWEVYSVTLMPPAVYISLQFQFMFEK